MSGPKKTDAQWAQEMRDQGQAGGLDTQAAPQNYPSWYRADGSKKGMGFFGPLKFHTGETSTELSIDVNIDGKDMAIPALVPTLSREEIDHLLKVGKTTPAIDKKAVEFAIQRMRAGKSPFAQEGEQVPLPPTSEELFMQGFNKPMQR